MVSFWNSGHKIDGWFLVMGSFRGENGGPVLGTLVLKEVVLGHGFNFRVDMEGRFLDSGVVSHQGFCCSSKLSTSERADHSIEVSSEVNRGSITIRIKYLIHCNNIKVMDKVANQNNYTKTHATITII